MYTYCMGEMTLKMTTMGRLQAYEMWTLKRTLCISLAGKVSILMSFEELLPAGIAKYRCE